MNPFEPPPGPEIVSARPPRRAGRVIAYAVLTAGGTVGAMGFGQAFGLDWPTIFTLNLRLFANQARWVY
jgi:hypothetical protein